MTIPIRIKLWLVHRRFKWKTRKGQKLWITYSDDTGRYLAIGWLEKGRVVWSKHYRVGEAVEGRGISTDRSEQDMGLFRAAMVSGRDDG